MTEQVELLVTFENGAQGIAFGETPRDFSPDDARIIIADDYRVHDDYNKLTVMLDRESMDWLGGMTKVHGEPRAFVVHAPELPQFKTGENKTDQKPLVQIDFETDPLPTGTREWIHSAALKAVAAFNGVVDARTLTYLYCGISDRCGYENYMPDGAHDIIVDEASQAFDVLTGKRAVVDGKFVLQYDYAEAEKRVATQLYPHQREAIEVLTHGEPFEGTYRTGTYRKDDYVSVANAFRRAYGHGATRVWADENLIHDEAHMIKGTVTGRWNGRNIGMTPELGMPYKPQWINPTRKAPEPVVTDIVHFPDVHDAHTVNPHIHVHGVADAETFKSSAGQIAQAVSRYHRQGLRRAIFVSPIDGSVDEEMLRRLQSKQTVNEALCDGDFAEDTSEDASDGGAIGGGAYGGRDGGEANDRRVGEGAHRELEGVQSRQEPARETCAGNHQSRHSILPQTSPSLGQEGGRSAMTLETKIVKVGSGYSVQLVQQGDQWQSGPKPDGSGWGNHALLTAPEMDALIAKLCKARDEVRRKNRPHHGIGTWRV